MEAHPAAGDWEQFRQTLRGRVTPVTWRAWLESLVLERSDETSVRIVAPSEFHLRWVNDKYRALIEEVARIAFGGPVTVELAAADGQAFEGPIVDDEPEPEPVPQVTPAHPEGGRLVPKYTFENFVVGPSNRFAHAAAMAIAEQPGGHYNPLFVYAGAGLGKTHLLQAIAQPRPRPPPPPRNQLHDLRGLLQRLHRRHPPQADGRVQGALPRVSTSSSSTMSSFWKARSRCSRSSSTRSTPCTKHGKQLVFIGRPAAAEPGDPRGPPAQSLRVGPDHRHPTPRRRNPARHPAQNAAFAPHEVPQPVLQIHRRPGGRQHPRAGGGADPGHRLRRSHPPAHRPRHGRRRAPGPRARHA